MHGGGHRAQGGESRRAGCQRLVRVKMSKGVKGLWGTLGQGRRGEQVTPGRRDVGKAGQGQWRASSASQRNYLCVHLPQFTHLNPGHNAFVKFK